MTVSHDKWLYFWEASLLLGAALNEYGSPAAPQWMDISPLSAPHLTTSSWVNKSIFMTCLWLHIRSVTLTSSDSIHGSTLPALISINDTEEEI